MRIVVQIDSREIPPNTDPIMELIPMFEENGYKLIENGVGSSYRHLVFEKIE